MQIFKIIKNLQKIITIVESVVCEEASSTDHSEETKGGACCPARWCQLKNGLHKLRHQSLEEEGKKKKWKRV